MKSLLFMLPAFVKHIMTSPGPCSRNFKLLVTLTLEASGRLRHTWVTG